MIVIKPVGGLCNKLRVVFSYYLLAKYKNEILIVIWIKCNECPGYFLDYFEPIDGVIFTNNTQNLKIDYNGCEINKNYPPKYKELKLLPSLFQKIQHKKKLFNNNYIAVHIRRTDHAVLAQKNNSFTTDDDFMNFIEEENNNNSMNLYIATDNKETYNKFADKYKNMVKLSYHPTINGLRKTTLENSIIDLYMCVYSNQFMGSGWSSFSKTIVALKNNLNSNTLQ